MFFQDIQMNNGTILRGEKIRKLVEEIIDKFSDEGLTCDEGKEVLEAVKSVLGEFSTVQKVH